MRFLGTVLLLGLSGAQAAVQFSHSDHLGSMTVATNSAGVVQQVQHYTPFGETVIARDPALAGDRSNLLTHPLYTGQELDLSSDLYYYGARYYDPALSRFMSVDPLFDSPSPYSYVANNPLSHTDPTGELLWDVVDVAVFGLNLHAYQEDPTWENGFWLVVSGAGLFPILPSGGYFSPAVAEEIAIVSETAVRASKVASRARVGMELGISLSGNAGGEGEGPTDLSRKRGERMIESGQKGNLQAIEHGASVENWRGRLSKMTAAEKRGEFNRIKLIAEQSDLGGRILGYANRYREFMGRPLRGEMSPFDLPDLLNEAIEGTQLDLRHALDKGQLPPREVGEFLDGLYSLF